MQTLDVEKMLRARITVIRECRGLSQGEASKRAGFERTMWHRFENGSRKITIPSLKEIARVLDVHMHELLDPQFPDRVLKCNSCEECHRCPADCDCNRGVRRCLNCGRKRTK